MKHRCETACEINWKLIWRRAVSFRLKEYIETHENGFRVAKTVKTHDGDMKTHDGYMKTHDGHMTDR